MAYHCQACGYEIILEVKVARLDRCDNCDADLHSCLNCHFYDKNADRCREDIKMYIRDRDRANFCAAFTYGHTDPDTKDEIADAKSKLDALFKF